MYTLLPRHRRIRLAPHTSRPRVHAVIGDLRELPGVLEADFDAGPLELVVAYDLALVCRGHIERWLKARDVHLLNSATARVLASAIHGREAAQREAALGALAHEVPCGKLDGYVRLGALYAAREAPAPGARMQAKRPSTLQFSI